MGFAFNPIKAACSARSMSSFRLPGVDAEQDAALVPAVSCQLCGGPARLPHRNCANLDCNRLFIACDDCTVRARGCCCHLRLVTCHTNLRSWVCSALGAVHGYSLQRVRGRHAGTGPVHVFSRQWSCVASCASAHGHRMQASTRSCCCEECISAPRLLRPAQHGGNYLEYAAYAIGQETQASIATVRHLIEYASQC